MTRNEAIALIEATLPSLDDEHVATMAELLRSWTRDSVYASLPDDEKGRIDAALDRLDAGKAVPGETVFASLAARLKAAGA